MEEASARKRPIGLRDEPGEIEKVSLSTGAFSGGMCSVTSYFHSTKRKETVTHLAFTGNTVMFVHGSGSIREGNDYLIVYECVRFYTDSLFN